MAENNQQQVNVDGKTLIIYNNRKADHYRISDIYDPLHPESGKVFPSMHSTVIKEDGSLWWVSARDESNYSVTLSPISIVQVDDSQTVRIVSYGNEKFCLYVDRRTSPYKLVVDAKLLFYGNNLVEYELSRVGTDGKSEVISMYLDSDDRFKSSRVPLAPIAEDKVAYKYPTNCHTTTTLAEGEPIIMRVYNNLGNLAAEVTLFVREVTWWNDLNSHTNPILKLDAECLQMRGDDFYIHQRQDPSHLNIQPYLLFHDGSRMNVAIDNITCFLYGLSDFIPSYPGYSQTLVIKYFLNHKETTVNNLNTGARRFLTCTKNLIVLDNESKYDVRVSFIPLFDRTTYTWKLRFFAYTDRRDSVYDITDLVSFDEEFTFDGTQSAWGKEQHVVIGYDLQSLFQTDQPLPGAQSLWIRVYDPDNAYVRFTFRNSPTDDHVFGVDGSITRRPVIWYDPSIEQYFIPTSIFGNWEAVVESFYHLTRPPFDIRTESQAPTPTHFTIRDPYNGQMLIGGPIPKEQYGQAWPMINGTAPMKGNTVIVEFLLEVAGEFRILYGVPVDVDKYDRVFNNEEHSTY